MKYFAVAYAYDPTDPRIAQVRPAHREFIGTLHAEGHIVGSGPHPDTTGGALIILSLEEDDASVEKATAIMDGDPFYAQGLLDSRTVREWNPVINSFA
ncbi:YciI family protein [Corynebacterium lizhenjunii]|uniref:YciI family protein n=1 Tax=Corynebacterium lizhenjunii TaxID=2709394 RepID=A0A7T0PB47_9CORY|nr:YciI family protein [Corynebacterium lizhenjunii]QPK78372.1 YciI family protein [Corynebacterium lizhenjunii]